MGRLKSLQCKNQSTDVPYFLKYFIDAFGNQFPCDFEDDFCSLWVVHDKKIHNFAEHLVSDQVRVDLNEPEMES